MLRSGWSGRWPDNLNQLYSLVIIETVLHWNVQSNQVQHLGVWQVNVVNWHVTLVWVWSGVDPLIEDLLWVFRNVHDLNFVDDLV
jgi:hypothetical protein